MTCGNCEHWQRGTTPSGARMWSSGFGQCAQRIEFADHVDKGLALASYEPRSRECRFTPSRWMEIQPIEVTEAREYGDD